MQGREPALARCGRLRRKIGNEGFNTQKRQGYRLEHQYSKGCGSRAVTSLHPAKKYVHFMAVCVIINTIVGREASSCFPAF